MARVLDIRKFYGIKVYLNRNVAKTVSKIVDDKGHEHNVKFADVLHQEYAVLFYDCDTEPIKVFGVDLIRRVLGPSVDIKNDKVANAHNQAIRELNSKIYNGR